MRAGLLFLVAVLALAAAPPAQAREELVADISSRQIDITSRFAGTSLLLFGAVDWYAARQTARLPGDAPTDAREYDIVVVVRGPDARHVVRRKTEVAGVWVNTEAAALQTLPGFYALSANRPLEAMFLPGEAARHGLGLDYLSLNWDGDAPADGDEYRAAVMRTMRDEGLFNEKFGSLQIMGQTLFRTEIHFPASVPVGRYRAEVYLVRNGMVVTHHSAPLLVDKVGLERAIYDFAHTQPAAYGLMAIIVAVLAGLLASTLSRRFSH
ncbi:MAG: TIGR02186 family protein [Sphingomonadales bacterium]